MKSIKREPLKCAVITADSFLRHVITCQLNPGYSSTFLQEGCIFLVPLARKQANDWLSRLSCYAYGNFCAGRRDGRIVFLPSDRLEPSYNGDGLLLSFVTRTSIPEEFNKKFLTIEEIGRLVKQLGYTIY